MLAGLLQGPSLGLQGALEELVAKCDRIQDSTGITAMDAARGTEVLACGKRLMEDVSHPVHQTEIF